MGMDCPLWSFVTVSKAFCTACFIITNVITLSISHYTQKQIWLLCLYDYNTLCEKITNKNKDWKWIEMNLQLPGDDSLVYVYNIYAWYVVCGHKFITHFHVKRSTELECIRGKWHIAMVQKAGKYDCIFEHHILWSYGIQITWFWLK